MANAQEIAFATQHFVFSPIDFFIKLIIDDNISTVSRQEERMIILNILWTYHSFKVWIYDQKLEILMA